mmetsp:Transcript_41284/g.39756  ORF Transcript_41284/g.39756 Transcript_41284/m.39756 type:complete len:118 (+) Transcript_41284:730-1083(+)
MHFRKVISKNTNSVQVLETGKILKCEEYYKFKSLAHSYKFFFIQINDLCDLISVLGLIYLMKQFNIGFVADLTDDKVKKYVAQSSIECVLELIYTILVPFLVRKFTIYKFFYPSVAG